MIGWKPNPFIFVHIPKCAGTSIEQALIPIATGKNGFPELTELDRCRYWLPGTKGLQHSKLRRYSRHFRLKRFFKFAIVRNPWDRAISQITYLRSTAHAHLFRRKNFKEQVRTYCTTTRYIWGHDLSACQADYLFGPNGKVAIDFVGRFESLEHDFTEVCRTIGIIPPPVLPHVFDSKRKVHYSAFYDDESAAWIKARFAKDIEMFDYHFEDRRGISSPSPIDSKVSDASILEAEVREESGISPEIVSAP